MIEKNNTFIKSKPFSSRYQISPPQMIILIFAILIGIGTVLLMMPFSSTTGETVGFTDALFTAVSAVCVNGLTVLNISDDLSLAGQIIVMILIQIGGLGFMTISVIIAIILGKRIGLKERLLIQQTTQASSAQGLVRLCIYIIVIVFAFESIATLVLTIHWQPEMGWGTAFYYGLFHSISAFNNAGFALWSDGLIAFVGDPIVNIVIITLFVAGGLGYIVIVELFQKKRWSKFSLHTKIVLSSSIVITLIGFSIIYLLESLNPATFGHLTWFERIQAAWFQTLVPRSSGFNTIDITDMLAASQFLLIIYMFIGAASGGTGGGIKINTIVVLILATITTFRGGGQVHAFGRRIPDGSVLRALAVVMSSLTVVLIVALALTITEDLLEDHFLEVLFEATSAFSTTGLTMGLTQDLSLPGKYIVGFTMFIGRLGPLTLAYALANRKQQSRIGYPEDNILIG
ncbi:TrkH family potassium uptake protein [Paenibacillus septentrionalis]|uniref:TrkH family potassium uptake protein n=1 Tax=Paenibacillus septentrionalis TaxID=429342 RepID=A0ABW1V8K8_9BACL